MRSAEFWHQQAEFQETSLRPVFVASDFKVLLRFCPIETQFFMQIWILAFYEPKCKWRELNKLHRKCFSFCIPSGTRMAMYIFMVLSAVHTISELCLLIVWIGINSRCAHTEFHWLDYGRHENSSTKKQKLQLIRIRIKFFVTTLSDVDSFGSCKWLAIFKLLIPSRVAPSIVSVQLMGPD